MLEVTILSLRGSEVLVTIGSVYVHLYFVWKLAKTTQFHPMLRRCLFIFESSSILFSVSHSAQGIIATLQGISERMFPLVLVKCTPTVLERLNGIFFVLASLASYTLWLSQTFSVLERALSTRFLESYDSRFRNVKSLIAFIVVFALVDFMQVSLVFTIRGNFLVFLMIFHSVVNLSLSLWLFRLNKKADRIETRLGVRYQVRENLKILRVFSVIGLLCMAWQLVATTLFVLTLSLYESQASDIIGHFYLISTDLYALTVTTTLLSSSVMRSSLLLRCRSIRAKKVKPMSEGEMYLNMLQSQWS